MAPTRMSRDDRDRLKRTIRALLQRGRLPRGMQSELARRFEVSRQDIHQIMRKLEAEAK